MRYIEAKIKIKLKKKTFLMGSIIDKTVFVRVPSEWNKNKIERFIIEAGYSLAERLPVRKSKIQKIVVISQNELRYRPRDVKCYEWDFDDNCGEWE